MVINKFLFILIILFFISSTIFAIEKVDINTATLDQLDKLDGIGLSYAQKIIDNRPFNSLEDLLKVKGIGNSTLQKIKDQALACINCTNKITIIAPSPLPALTIYPNGVIINEILPNPQGSDEENEFIELYNTNNFDIDLSGWKIQDTEGTITTYIIPQNSIILANSFLVFKRPDTKISLNNSGDTINLLFPNNKITNFVSFTKSITGQSYNLINSEWLWSETLTPKSQNINSNLTTTNTTNLKITLSKTQNSGNNIVEANQLLASLSTNQNTPENKNINNPWILFLIVLAVAIIFSITILVLKIKFNL